jgi:glycosyltransferase involved in cell wall biosynthesis
LIRMTDLPRVTVLMPVYNGETYLREAVDSVLHQTLDDFEFLIVDDGSTDSSAAILESYTDPRIRVVHNPTNLKLVATLNKGLDLARGEYVARMDCDDISLPERLEKQLAFMEAHSEVGVLGTACQYIDGCSRPGLVRSNPTPHSLIRWHLCFTCPMTHPTVMMRKSIIQQLGAYASQAIRGREKYSAEDYDLWRRASSVTELANLPEVLLYLRKHEANVTRIHQAGNLENSIRISHLVISEFLGEPVPLDIVALLWREDFQNADQVLQAARLVCRLYQAGVTGEALSGADRRLMRRYVATRLFAMAYLGMRYIRSWPVFGWAWRFGPLLVSRFFLKSFWRNIQRGLRLKRT